MATKERGLFTAEKAWEYRKLPLEEDLCMIHWSNAPLQSALLLHLLEYLRQDENLRIAIPVKNYDALKSVHPGVVEDSRVRLVIANTDEYIRTLCTAKTVYTAVFLPEYYTKREGQLVRGILPEEMVYPETLTPRMIRLGLHTSEEVDEILDLNLVENGVPRASENAEEIVIGFGESSPFYKNGYFKNIISALSGYADKAKRTIAYYLPAARWEEYSAEENVPAEQLRSTSEDVRMAMAGAKLVVTDQQAVVDFATRLGTPCLYMAKAVLREDSATLTTVYNLEELYEEFEQLLSQLPERSSSSGKVLLDKTVFADGWQPVPRAEKKKVLVVSDWATLQPYSHRLVHWAKNAEKEGLQVDLLFRSSAFGDVYQHLGGTPATGRITCRTGFYQSDEKTRERIGEAESVEDLKEEVFAEMAETEWRRMLGGGKYAEIWALETGDVFWQLLYEHAPSDRMEVLSSVGFLAKLEYFFLSPEANTQALSREDLKRVLLDEKEQVYLGKQMDTEYYIPAEMVSEEFVLCKWTGKNRESLRKKVLDRCERGDRVLLIDTVRHGSHEDWPEKVRVLTMPTVPLPLVLTCKELLSADDSLSVLVSTLADIPTESPEGLNCKTADPADRMMLLRNRALERFIKDDDLPWVL